MRHVIRDPGSAGPSTELGSRYVGHNSDTKNMMRSRPQNAACEWGGGRDRLTPMRRSAGKGGGGEYGRGRGIGCSGVDNSRRALAASPIISEEHFKIITRNQNFLLKS